MDTHTPTGQLHNVDGVVEKLAFKDRRAVYRLLESGQLAHYRIGRKIRVSDAQIEAFLAAREVVA